MVVAIYDLIRQQRNELGHPREDPPQLTRDDMLGGLQSFIRYCETAGELRTCLATTTVEPTHWDQKSTAGRAGQRHPAFFTNSLIAIALAAPSPTAEATCLVLPCRASPAANTPGTLLSKGRGLWLL